MVVVIIFLFTLSIYAYAQEITGAFGIRFGKKLDGLKIIRESKTTSGEPLYEIIPPKPIKLLSEYYVMATPITKKVYSLWGIERNLDEAECKARMEAILIILEKKYKVERRKPLLSFSPGYYIEKGDAQISVRCSQDYMSGYELYIQYYHDKLEKQAKKEAAKLRSQQIDESGL